jgi:hypothetical protein
MKITKRQLNRIIKEELASTLDESDFFAGEEEEETQIRAKQKFRKFRDDTDTLIKKLTKITQIQQALAKAKHAALDPNHEFWGKYYFGQDELSAQFNSSIFMRKAPKLIKYLGKNLERLTSKDPKSGGAMHSGESPLEEATPENSPDLVMYRHIKDTNKALILYTQKYSRDDQDTAYLSEAAVNFIKQYAGRGDSKNTLRDVQNALWQWIEKKREATTA